MSYFKMLVKLICVFFCIIGSCMSTEQSGNTTSSEDKVKLIDNTTDTSAEDIAEWIQNSTKIMGKLMTNYDSTMAPFAPGKPVKMHISFDILALGEVDEANMEYGLDIIFFQVWTDVRLAQGQDRIFSFSGNDVNKIWTPDTYFLNAKHTEIKNVMKDNKVVYIMPNGMVAQMSRITVIAACHMELQMYPFDRQKCDLVIESFSLAKHKLAYAWSNLQPGASKCKVLVYDDAMSQYVYKGVKLSYDHTTFVSPSFSNLYARFVFDRRTSYTVLQVYIPTYMIVILSFMALWLPQDAVPARIALGITTVLTIVYFQGTVNSRMPRVSYMKAIDIHLFVSFGFVFATMLEYVILLNVKGRKKRDLPNDENYELSPLNNYTSEEVSPSYPCSADIAVRYRLGGKENHSADEETLTSLSKTPHRKKMKMCDRVSIDKLSRILFPASYAAFVITYWVVCAVLSPQREELDLC